MRGRRTPRGRGVAPHTDQHVDDLTVLIDRPVEVLPPASDLDVGLLDKPAITRGLPSWPGSIDELSREPLHPPVDHVTWSTSMPRSANNSSTSR